MEENTRESKLVDIADRLNEISEDMLGVAEILFIMRQYDAAGSGGAESLLNLRKVVERHSQQIHEIANQL